MLKRFCSLILCMALICALFSGCGYKSRDLKLEGEYTKDFAGSQLNVYNWGEYISDGSYDMMDVNREFERVTGIHVNYTTFESNETMYSQLKSGGVSYDIIIPSDYMIERLINEDMLEKIDVSKLHNYGYIYDNYKNLFYDKNNEYSVPYNVGMVGIIYNPTMIDEPKHSWKSLWDEKYRGMSLNFSNPRDGFMTAQMILGQDLNTTNKADWDAAANLLKKGKDVLQSYVMDEIYGKMETGEAAIGPYYAGDYLTMLENNEDLEFFYPEEGTNIFVDAVCVPKSVKHKSEAMLYIDFLLEPEVALHNAEYICYASPHRAVVENPEYTYYKNEILYPDPEDMPPVQYYHDIDPEIRAYYENLWIDLKLY
ncbi:MAG: ABC transporter substrate-binding protein [Clostridia bacterium]|nr:ABC transporter substrate-binding protein [Clostridia bacterium]